MTRPEQDNSWSNVEPPADLVEPDSDFEPDFEAILEARSHRSDPDAAERSYERSIYGD